MTLAEARASEELKVYGTPVLKPVYEHLRGWSNAIHPGDVLELDGVEYHVPLENCRCLPIVIEEEP